MAFQWTIGCLVYQQQLSSMGYCRILPCQDVRIAFLNWCPRAPITTVSIYIFACGIELCTRICIYFSCLPLPRHRIQLLCLPDKKGTFQKVRYTMLTRPPPLPHSSYRSETIGGPRGNIENRDTQRTHTLAKLTPTISSLNHDWTSVDNISVSMPLKLLIPKTFVTRS